MAQKRAPLPYGHGAGDMQVLTEALACLIRRQPQETLLVTVAERLELFETFRTGYGLVCFQDGATGAIKLTLTGDQALPGVEEIMRDVENGRTDRVPSMFRPPKPPPGARS